MEQNRSWALYPNGYRAKDIVTLIEWIKAGESGSVIGLPGIGKSNMLGFMCHRLEVIQPHLPHKSSKLALIYVDLNNLPDSSLATFYRVVLRGLYEVQDQLATIEPALAATIETLYHKIEEKTDPFISQSALRRMLLLFQANGVRVVLVLDPFDRFCQTASIQLLDNLRGLRDSFKSTLTYLVGIRHELAYLRSPQEMGELFEILDTHFHWVGPMEQDDALWIVRQMQESLGHQFTTEETERLIDLTGAYPFLLRTAIIWLAQVRPKQQSIPLDADRESWIAELLTQPGIQNRLQELWNTLTGVEQEVIAELQQATGRKSQQFWQKRNDTLTRLEMKHICYRTDQNNWQLFSSLFAAYVDQVGAANTGKIWQRADDDTLLRGSENLEQKLTPQTRRLLCFLLEHPHKILEKDRIISALWAEDEILDEGIDDMRLQKAISQLRGVLDVEGGSRYIHTVRGIGYRFFPEGAPQTMRNYEEES